ncbi:MAG: four-helix bundle copper-binding protein [Methylotenera sp.]
MLSPKETECLNACNDCTTACVQSATACLKEIDPKAMARCIALDRECADICRMAATSITCDSKHMKTICALCAEACQNCANECDKHEMGHCKNCAEICKHCAELCRGMVH